MLRAAKGFFILGEVNPQRHCSVLLNLEKLSEWLKFPKGTLNLMVR